ncbi:UbiD family decarboxylase [Bacillus sp. SN10]|uniref:UbiD family decarboxylase n=1 Tax=Bacillus sp. SN10 TaxID=2056493 RepID=UPI000C339CF9|nr:UbiD family decarboxylase [Bacillus sp. SN10]PKJ52071.1 UbiD family decarboxylase [Bacillus sp. SN10]
MKSRQLKSIREYITTLEEIGEIKLIDEEVDWNLEMGAIIRYCNENGLPAPLFNNVKDTKGFRVLGAPVGISKEDKLYLARYALSIGLSPTATGQDIVNALIKGRNNKPIPPIEVLSAPCKENIIKSADIDLYKLPVPLAHMGDGGRYINTFGTIIVQTPDEKWTNWSIARIMIADKAKMTGLVLPFQHIGKIHAEWKKINKPTPFALALGTQPMIPIIASTPLPKGMNEVDYIGGYFGNPLELVRAETSNLLIPIESEIVIEGTISHNETANEGPMGEYPGYIWNKSASKQPVYNVTCITHRDDAILPMVVTGAPIDDAHPVIGIGGAAEILHCLRSSGVPATMAWSPLETACHWLVITMPRDWKKKMNSNTKDLMQNIADVIFNNKFSTVTSKILVLGDDIDPTNTSEVLWAYTTRVHPTRDVYTYTDHVTISLLGYLSNEERRNGKTTAVIYNGLAPDEWEEKDYPIRSSFKYGYPKQIQEKALLKLKNARFIKEYN